LLYIFFFDVFIDTLGDCLLICLIVADAMDSSSLCTQVIVIVSGLCTPARLLIC